MKPKEVSITCSAVASCIGTKMGGIDCSCSTDQPLCTNGQSIDKNMSGHTQIIDVDHANNHHVAQTIRRRLSLLLIHLTNGCDGGRRVLWRRQFHDVQSRNRTQQTAT